jgi:hypothetical protein
MLQLSVKQRITCQSFATFEANPPLEMVTVPTPARAAFPMPIRTPHASILAHLTTRPAMTFAGIVINCSRDERSQFCAFGRLEN